MNDDPRARFGRVISSVGYLWVVLFFASNFFDTRGTGIDRFLGFFGDSFFIPIMLIFGGRTLNRRARRLGRPSSEGESEMEPSQHQARPPMERQPLPPTPPAQDPIIFETVETANVDADVDIDELAAAIGIDSSDEPIETTMPPLEFDDGESRSSEDLIREAHEKWASSD